MKRFVPVLFHFGFVPSGLSRSVQVFSRARDLLKKADILAKFIDSPPNHGPAFVSEHPGRRSVCVLGLMVFRIASI